jgi:hypothetical protein
MTMPPFPRDPARARVTLRLQDFALADRDTVYPAPIGGDWILLVLLVAILMANGLYVWYQRGWNDAIGRAVFFGLALFCVYWSAIIYALKLSLSVRVGPHSLYLVRGPWRMELRWSEVERLAERMETTHGQRYRWVVATAYDGRRLQVREDMVANYAEFRIEVYERHHLWQEHGGTWGTHGGGPYVVSDHVSGPVRWWLLASTAFLLPAIYLLLLVPGVAPVGIVLLFLSTVCLTLLVRVVLRRQQYTIEPKVIECRRPLHPSVRLAWRELVRVERARRAAGFLVGFGIGVGRLALALAARTDSRASSFPWSPRVPEYLTLRGGGRQIRIRLHRLDRPDELLAWVEFYERIARVGDERQARSATPTLGLPGPELVPDELGGSFGPSDPWSGGRGGELDEVWLSETHHQPQARDDGSPVSATSHGETSVSSGHDLPRPSTPEPPTPMISGAQMQPSPSLGAGPAGWEYSDEVPGDGENQPTDSVDGLAESFAPWRDEHQDPPPMPRYGPPPKP